MSIPHLELSPKTILAYLKDVKHPTSKRELARAFDLKGSDKIPLKKLLRKMTKDGVLEKHGDKYQAAGALPDVLIARVSLINDDGDEIAVPAQWNEDVQGKPPTLRIIHKKNKPVSLGMGDYALVRLSQSDDEDNVYEARIIKKLDKDNAGAPMRITGIVHIHGDHGGYLQSLSKKSGNKKSREKGRKHGKDKAPRYDYEIARENLNGAQNGDLVAAVSLPGHGFKRKKARITEVIGRADDPKSISLLSLSEAGFDLDFPDDVRRAADKIKAQADKVDTRKRKDLRDIPLITIDGADARDFDDAVFAERTDDGGHHIIVAIADVAQFLKSGEPLDREAQKRGNSTYFPDRVVPMLPEVLSNDLCSLRPHEDRLCVAAHLYIDRNGKLTNYKFVRGIMRSHARMTYEQVQAIYNGELAFEFGHKAFTKDNITVLYEAFHTLFAAREKRGALDLDLPERKIIIDDDGNMTGVEKRVRLDAHRVIEEFMVLANVAAAKALETKNAPCVYRVHEPPSLDKLESSREFLKSFNLSLPRGQVPKPAGLNMLLKKAAENPYSHLISQVILRTQSQAYYGTDNKRHYGLALEKYAHFTSPIRRYADVLVHRALIRAYSLGEGGLSDDEVPMMEQICVNISECERRSMAAERAAVDRFTAAFLSEKTGAVFGGRISSVTRFGLFITLDETSADGLVPIRSLPGRDYYVHDETAHALIGRETRTVFRLGATVRVRIAEIEPLTGSILLSLEGHQDGADITGTSLPTPSYSPRRKPRDGKHKKKRATPKHKRRRR